MTSETQALLERDITSMNYTQFAMHLNSLKDRIAILTAGQDYANGLIEYIRRHETSAQMRTRQDLFVQLALGLKQSEADLLAQLTRERDAIEDKINAFLRASGSSPSNTRAGDLPELLLASGSVIPGTWLQVTGRWRFKPQDNASALSELNLFTVNSDGQQVQVQGQWEAITVGNETSWYFTPNNSPGGGNAGGGDGT